MPPSAPDTSPAGRAAAAANAALDRAYAKSGATEKRNGPWVRADNAVAQPDKRGGTVYRWSAHPTAGFEYEAEVLVDAKGNVTVRKATATFSPD